MEFVTCTNCGKTMPKEITGIPQLDKMVPDKVFCDRFCYDEYNNNTDICPICGDVKPISDLHRNCGK